MEWEEYQIAAHKISGQKDIDSMLLMGALGLNGEAGEVADLIKKTIFHGHDLDFEKLELELGDVLWYIAELATAIHTTLESVATKNLEKLQKRYGEKFSSERSINRDENS